MKMIKISVLALVTGCVLFNSSCKKSFYTEANVNSNAPNTVTPATLLSTVEGTLAYSQGGDLSRFASIFMQQTNGVARQAQAYNQYIFTGQDVDNTWGNIFTSVMENNYQLILNADAHAYNAYSGVGRILMAYSLQITVDCWGKVPYSAALQGVKNLKPAYDDDASLYATIQSLCDSGIIYLDNPVAGFATPGGEDVIYGGDAALWIKFAHAIKARTYIHQSKTSNANAGKALAEISLSFADNTESAKYAFNKAGNANNPWYQFNQQRGDISFASSTLATDLLDNNDPRFPFIVDTSADNGGDYLGGYYGNPDAVVELITYDELQFMAAEATVKSGGTVAAAQTYYKDGIKASMQKLGVATADIDTYIVHNGTITATNAVSKIAYEGWVAMYLNPEAWTLWRRTGYPSLTPTKAGANIPRRLLYPQTEYSYNTANTPESSMYAPKLFWDN